MLTPSLRGAFTLASPCARVLRFGQPLKGHLLKGFPSPVTQTCTRPCSPSQALWDLEGGGGGLTKMNLFVTADPPVLGALISLGM